MAGRSQFDPEYCDVAREVLAEGYSVAGLAGKIGVARSTVYKWVDDFPEFSDAVKEGQASAVAFWEARLIDLAKGEDGNVTSVIFGLKNRAPEEWRDVTRSEHTGADGGPIQTEEVSAREIILAKLGVSAKPD